MKSAQLQHSQADVLLTAVAASAAAQNVVAETLSVATLLRTTAVPELLSRPGFRSKGSGGQELQEPMREGEGGETMTAATSCLPALCLGRGVRLTPAAIVWHRRLLK